MIHTKKAQLGPTRLVVGFIFLVCMAILTFVIFSVALSMQESNTKDYFSSNAQTFHQKRNIDSLLQSKVTINDIAYPLWFVLISDFNQQTKNQQEAPIFDQEQFTTDLNRLFGERNWRIDVLTKDHKKEYGYALGTSHVTASEFTFTLSESINNQENSLQEYLLRVVVVS